MMKGWVYVISNKAMDGIIKVGHSMKEPELRAQELNHTGSPHPYVVEYEMLVDQPSQIEQKVHKLLSSKCEGKEWFRCSPEEAIAAIKQVAGNSLITENFKKAQREKAEQIRRQQEKEGKIEQKLRDEENEIRRKYEQIIASNFPPRPFWNYWLGGSVLLLIGVAILFPKASDSVLFLIVIGGAIIGYFLQDYFEKKRKESAAYKALLQERDEELANIRTRVVECPGCQRNVRYSRSKLLLSSPDTVWRCPECKTVLDLRLSTNEYSGKAR